MAPTALLQIKPFQTHGGAVHERLRSMISSRELAPGDSFSLREMASRLGVSITPVRDAIQMLRNHGLLEKTARLGYRVVTVTRERILGYYAVRRALLAEAARLATERITDPDLCDLSALAARTDALIEAGNYDEAAPLDNAFHTRLARIAGLPFLEAQIARLDAFGIMLSAPVPPHWHSHKRLVDALRARDPDLAALEVRAHVDNALQCDLTARESEGAQEPSPSLEN
ncbi:MAG: GntR family transcriptional regulator [Planctomycetota bacterium]